MGASIRGALRVRPAPSVRTRLPPAATPATARARGVRPATQHSARLPPAAQPATASAHRARPAPRAQSTRLSPARRVAQPPTTACARRARRPARGTPTSRQPHAPRPPTGFAHRTHRLVLCAGASKRTSFCQAAWPAIRSATAARSTVAWPPPRPPALRLVTRAAVL